MFVILVVDDFVSIDIYTHIPIQCLIYGENDCTKSSVAANAQMWYSRTSKLSNSNKQKAIFAHPNINAGSNLPKSLN